MVKQSLFLFGLLSITVIAIFLWPTASVQTAPTTGNILMFVAYEDVWWAEYKVLYEGLIAAGYSNKQMASELGISHNTVARHVANIMRKMGAGNRTEAVLNAIRQQLIPFG